VKGRERPKGGGVGLGQGDERCGLGFVGGCWGLVSVVWFGLGVVCAQPGR